MDYFINNISDGDDARNNLRVRKNTCKKKKGNGKKDNNYIQCSSWVLKIHVHCMSFMNMSYYEYCSLSDNNSAIS